MPRVLRKLRIDEISAVDRAAGEGTHIVLRKRDDERDPDFYYKLFAGVGKRSGRVVRRPRRLRGRDQLADVADAKHALLHSPDGRQMLRDVPNASIDELAQQLLEASSAVTNKRDKETDMSDNLIEVCKGVVSGTVEPPSEHELTAEIQKLANSMRKPGETSAAAFARLYDAQDDDGLMLRKTIALCKRANGFPL
jgi:hypothetical protein